MVSAEVRAERRYGSTWEVRSLRSTCIINWGLRWPGGRFVFSDKTRLPTSKVMEKARMETFGVAGRWMHDQTKGHGASSKKVELLTFCR